MTAVGLQGAVANAPLGYFPLGCVVFTLAKISGVATFNRASCLRFQ